MRTIRSKEWNEKTIRICIIFFLIILNIFAVVLYYYDKTKPEMDAERKRLVRDISNIKDFSFEEEPVGRNVAWSQELPFFIRQDMRKASDVRYDIVYTCFGNKLKFTNSFERWMVSAENGSNSDVTDKYTNFSIYESKEGNIVLYGHEQFSKEFVKLTMGDQIFKKETLTFDNNLPFDKENSSQTIRVEGMSLLKEGEAFNFYLKGKKISTQLFIGCNKSEIENGFMISDKNKLFILYYNISDEKPYVKFVSVSNGDNIETIEKTELISKERWSDERLSVFMKDGEQYVAIPESWETYNALKIDNVDRKKSSFDEANYNINLEKLEDYFVDAEFNYYGTYDDKGEWEIKKNYKINEKEYYFTVKFDGYDKDVLLPEVIANQYQKSVASEDEIWANIDTIRNVYKDYYEHKGE